MACFLVPVAEAIVVSVARKRTEKKEKQNLLEHDRVEGLAVHTEKTAKVPFSRKLKWLTNMLWGGSFLLLIEHIWHGEVVPWPPFLTAMNSAADTSAMLHEMATVGVTMAVAVTAVWGVMVAVSNYREKKAEEREIASAKEV